MNIILFVNSNHFYISGLCLRSLVNIQDKIDNIYIITPKIESLRLFHTWLGFRDIQYISDKHICRHLGMSGNRLHWTKQWAMLNIDRFLEGETFFITDADVIFNTKTQFLHGTKRKFVIEYEYYAPYFNTIKDLTGIEKTLPKKDSFISDFMVFDSRYLRELRNSNNVFADTQTWLQVVERNKHPTDPCIAFSEYELYGTWLYHHYPECMILEKSKIYPENDTYYLFQPTQDNLAATPDIIALRNTYDQDIDWQRIYPDGWQNFKLIQNQ